MKCKDQIKLTPEEEKLLNEQVFNIFCDCFRIVRARFPEITDPLNKQPDDESANDCTCKENKN